MSRADRDLPIWARPEPGGRRPQLSRAQIATAALRIADAEGFEAVTMRRLAGELGAGTMSLYRYVSTKDDLVALMDDALMGEALVPEGALPSSWRDALMVLARRTRAALLRHPWAVIALQEAQFGPNAMRHFEQSLAAVATTGVDSAAKFELLALVDDYVFGHVVRAGEARKRLAMAEADPEMVRRMIAFGMRELESRSYPHMAALVKDGANASPALGEEALAAQFERGLLALLDGAAARFAISDGGGAVDGADT